MRGEVQSKEAPSAQVVPAGVPNMLLRDLFALLSVKLGVPLGTIEQTARRLRGAGLIERGKGGRGGNRAPAASPEAAVRMLVALIGSPGPANL